MSSQDGAGTPSNLQNEDGNMHIWFVKTVIANMRDSPCYHSQTGREA